MTKGRHIRCYDYVNHRYERVRDALTGDALSIFQQATNAAAHRASSVAAELHVDIAGLHIGSEIAIHLRGSHEDPERPETRLLLEWESSQTPHLFPMMEAELAIYPLTSTETQLDFAGTYVPPLGVLGSAINAMVGHRVADASVHRFITDVATFLRKELSRHDPPRSD